MPKMLLLLLLLCCLHQQVASSSPTCTRRWQWYRMPRCPSVAGLGTPPVVLATEAQCVYLCTTRLPQCKAAHFKDSVCSIAANLSELSLWTAAGTDDQCRSLTMAPEILQLLVFFDFRESLQNVLGTASIATMQPLNLLRDDGGLQFAGRMTSLLKLTLPGGLSALTDRNGERAISIFMYIRRPYKPRTVYLKIGTDSTDVINLYEESGILKFMCSSVGKTFTSTDAFMQSDSDPNGFFLGVAASNITGAFAFLNNRTYGFAAANSNVQVADTMIRLGMSTGSDDSCLSGTMVCFGIAAGKLSAEQLSRLSLMCS